MSEDRSKAFAPREAANDDNVISTGQNERSNSKTLGNPWEKDANKYLAADEEILGTEAQKYRLNNTDPAESTSLSARTISAEDIESPPQIDAKVIDVPPDGGYGWVCVACVFLINAHTWGLNSTYGVFLAYYLANNTYPGATALDYGFIGGLSVSMALFVSPFATISTRKYGIRTTLTIGILFETAALLGASFSTEIWQLFLSQGICFGWGMGFLFVGTVGVVPQWFLKRRSFANSIGTAGSGIGALIYSLSSSAMIQSIGLPWAFRVLAILAFSVNGICALLIRDRNKAVGAIQMAFDLSLFRRYEYMLLLGWGFFSMLGYIVLLFSLPAYAASIGLTAQQGSVIGALLNLGQGIGRPFVGYFSDAAGRINMALVCTFLAGVFSLVIWIFAKSYGVLILFALIGGTVAGTFWTTIGPVGAEVVGLQILPSALNIVWLILVLPCTFSEPIGLELRTASTNPYLHAQVFTGLMYIGAAICMWFLRAWKIAELERVEAEDVARATAAPGIVSNSGTRGEKRERAIRDDDQVPRGPAKLTGLSRSTSVAASVKSKAKIAKGLWAWQRV